MFALKTMDIPMSAMHKFDGTNFQSWKYLMQNVLVASGLYDLVTGTRKQPNEDTVKDAELILRGNAKAMPC